MLDKIMKPWIFLYNYYTLKRNHIKYQSDLHIKGKLFIMGNIEIGRNVSINSGYKYNPIGGSDRTILFTHGNGKIIIGNNVGISNSAIVAADNITIEDNVMIGGNCKIYDTDFHSIKNEHRMQKPDTHIKTAPVYIMEGAFIGAHSIILKGVIIGKHSVIGAGSVVTKSVPDGEIWAGNPAHFIRKVQ